jgi:hypothetical protein
MWLFTPYNKYLIHGFRDALSYSSEWIEPRVVADAFLMLLFGAEG